MNPKLENEGDYGAGDGDGDGCDEGIGFLDDYTFGTGSGYCGTLVFGRTANGKGYGDGTGVG